MTHVEPEHAGCRLVAALLILPQDKREKEGEDVASQWRVRVKMLLEQQSQAKDSCLGVTKRRLLLQCLTE